MNVKQILEQEQGILKVRLIPSIALMPLQQQILLQESVNNKLGPLIRQFLLFLLQLKHQQLLFSLYHLRKFLLHSSLLALESLVAVSHALKTSKTRFSPSRIPGLEERIPVPIL